MGLPAQSSASADSETLHLCVPSTSCWATFSHPLRGFSSFAARLGQPGPGNLESPEHGGYSFGGEHAVARGAQHVGDGGADVAVVLEYRNEIAAGALGNAVTPVDEIVVVAKDASAERWRAATDAIVLDVFTNRYDRLFCHVCHIPYPPWINGINSLGVDL